MRLKQCERGRTMRYKHLIFVLLLASLVITLTLASRAENDRDKLGLIGPVALLETAEVRFIAEAGGWAEQECIPVSHITLDESGNKLDERIDSDGAPATKIVYSHNTEGLLTGLITLNLRTMSHTTQTLTYDDRQRLKEMTANNKDGSLLFKTVYHYGEGSQPDESVTHDAVGRVTERKQFDYDKHKNITGEKVFREDGTLIRESVYAYDAHGNMVESSEFDSRKMLTVKWHYHFDDKDRLIAAYRFRAFANLEEKQVFAYLDDSRGNWTKKLAFAEKEKNGKTVYDLQKLESRALTYFNGKLPEDKTRPATAIAPAPLLEYLETKGKTIFNIVQTAP